MMLYLTGRRSGRSYRQPVSYVKAGDSPLTPGGGNWKLNLDSGRPERIRLNGRDVTARPDLIDDVGEIDTALMTMTAANPRTASFIPIPIRQLTYLADPIDTRFLKAFNGVSRPRQLDATHPLEMRSHPSRALPRTAREPARGRSLSDGRAVHRCVGLYR
jgi:hypothetical protein